MELKIVNQCSDIENRIGLLVMQGNCILDALKSGAVGDVATVLSLKLTPQFITAVETVLMQFITDVDYIQLTESKKWFAHLALNLPQQNYPPLEMLSINAVDRIDLDVAINSLVGHLYPDELFEAIYLIVTRNHPTLVQLLISAISFAFTQRQQLTLPRNSANVKPPYLRLV